MPSYSRPAALPELDPELLVHTLDVLAEVLGADAEGAPTRGREPVEGMRGLPCRFVEYSGREAAEARRAGHDVVGVCYLAGRVAVPPTALVRWAETGRVYSVSRVDDVHGLGHHTTIDLRARVG